MIVPVGLRDRFGGVAALEIEARDVRALVAALDARAPGFAAEVDANMAVAIDGEIHPDAFLEPLDEGSEVHFLPRIRGG